MRTLRVNGLKSTLARSRDSLCGSNAGHRDCSVPRADLPESSSNGLGPKQSVLLQIATNCGNGADSNVASQLRRVRGPRRTLSVDSQLCHTASWPVIAALDLLILRLVNQQHCRPNYEAPQTFNRLLGPRVGCESTNEKALPHLAPADVHNFKELSGQQDVALSFSSSLTGKLADLVRPGEDAKVRALSLHLVIQLQYLS